jgi:fucose permease
MAETRLILALSVLSTGGLAAALLLAGSDRSAAAGFVVAGLGFSGIFPAVISLGGRAGPHDTGAVMGVLVTGAAIGGIAIPWSMSALADRAGLTAGMVFYLASCACMTLLGGVVARRRVM